MQELCSQSEIISIKLIEISNVDNFKFHDNMLYSLLEKTKCLHLSNIANIYGTTLTDKFPGV